MDTEEEELAPAVRSILASARDREGRQTRVQATARDLPAAIDGADADGRVPVLAEIKPTSPTTEGRRTDDPLVLAERMVAGGAAGLSVLTEPDHFGGSTETLRRIRSEVDVPVLRKDFIVRETQLDEVATDLVLLIVRFLNRGWADDLTDLIDAVRERGMEPLVEVHTVEELEQAVGAGARIVGVNNRDLAALEVDLGTFERVAPEAPADVTLIAESGIMTPADARRMRRAGADGLLIGSAIMDGDVQANTRRFTTAEAEGDV